MPWGRGGAGNIAQAQAAQQKAATEPSPQARDLEAQPPSASDGHTPASSRDPTADHDPTTATAAAAPPQTQQYAHKGRGGAGNWYSPADLSAQGTFSSTSTPAAAPDAEPATAAASSLSASAGGGSAGGSVVLPTARTGRGGAGNFVWGDGGKAAAAEEEKKSRRGEEVSAQVAEDVERGLARPGGVHVPVGSGRRVDDGPAVVMFPA